MVGELVAFGPLSTHPQPGLDIFIFHDLLPPTVVFHVYLKGRNLDRRRILYLSIVSVCHKRRKAEQRLRFGE